MGGSSSKLPLAVPTEEKGVQTAPHPGTQEEIMQKEVDTILEMSLGRKVPPTTTTTQASQTENIPEASASAPTRLFLPIPPTTTRIESHEHEVSSMWLPKTDGVVWGPIGYAIDDVQEARRQVEDLRSQIESLSEESRAAREDRRQQKRKAEESVQSQLSALQTGIESIQKNQERVLEALTDESRKRARLVQVFEERLPELDIVSDVVSELMVIKEDLEEAVMNLKRPFQKQSAAAAAAAAESTRPPIDAMVRGHHALNLNVPSPRYLSSKGLYVHDIEDARGQLLMVPASPTVEAVSSKQASMHTIGTPCFGTPSPDSRGNTTTASGSASPSSSPESPFPSYDFGGFAGNDSSSSPRSLELDS